MTRIATTLALAFALTAGLTGIAQAQDADDLRTLCAELERLETPGVVDCYQAMADVEAAETEDEANAIVRRYFETDSPYDFQRIVANAGEAGATLFDDAE